MGPEMVAGLFVLGGALVGAVVSTGAVIWQQRKTAHEAERTHLLGLSEAAANEVIRLSYELQDHFAEDVDVDPFNSRYWAWASRLAELNRSLEQQALRFADPEVRCFLERIHAEIDRNPVRLCRPKTTHDCASPHLPGLRHAGGVVDQRSRSCWPLLTTPLRRAR